MKTSTFTVSDPETVSGLAALFVMEDGVGDPPIVFVHGLGADHYEFIHQVRYFNNRHRCIAFDQRGHGRSPGTANMGIDRSVLDLETLVDDLELDSFILIGHSLGTMVSFRYTLEHPERVEKLVIASGSPSMKESVISHFGLKLLPQLGRLMDDRQRRRISNIVGFNIGTFGLRTTPDVLRHYFQESPFSFSDKFFKEVGPYMTDIADFDVKEHIKKIECPVLVTHGMFDFGIYALPTLLMVQSIPNVHLRVFPTCGHSPNVEAPGEFNSVVEKFLEKNTAGNSPGMRGD